MSVSPSTDYAFPLGALPHTNPWCAWAEYLTGRSLSACLADEWLSQFLVPEETWHRPLWSRFYISRECGRWWGEPEPVSRATEHRMRAAYWSASGLPPTRRRRPWRALALAHGWTAGHSTAQLANRMALREDTVIAILRDLARDRVWATIAPMVDCP